MKIVDVIAAVFLILGGLNWGMVGVFDFNLGNFLFAKAPGTVRIIYILIGLSAVYQIYQWRSIQRRWR